MKVAFVYGNPGHHVEMMAPVMRALIADGVECVALSFAELRGMTTRALDVPGVRAARVLPARIRRSPAVGGSFGVDGSGIAGRVRRAVQLAVLAALTPRLVHLLRGVDVVVVPNDAVYPYRELCAGLRRRRTPFVLVQEGIRFPLPGVAARDAYGAGGAAAICAWGEASADYFHRQGAPKDRVVVTGSPRFDDVDVERWRREGAALRARLGLATPPLVILSNPIDDQGFVTTAAKLALFGELCDAAAEAIGGDERVVVKLHPREDAAGFRAAAAASRLRERAIVIDDQPLHAVLGAARAAIVLASTVGLEALLFDLPLGIVEIPGHGYPFDYGGAARPLGPAARAAEPLRRLLAPASSTTDERAARERAIGRQLDRRRDAARAVADAIVEIGRAA